MWREFRTSMTLPLPVESVFGFFSDAGNLQKITPPELNFRFVTELPIAMRAGAVIDYRLQLFGVPFGWRTRIVHWDPPRSFVDEQERGPYRKWIHTHTFSPVDEGTMVADSVRYRLPLFPFGEIAGPLVKRQIGRIFEYREKTIRTLLLGRGPSLEREGTAS